MFGDRLTEAMREKGPLCVGIDPHDHLLDAWGLPRTAAGVREFSLAAVSGLAGSVAAIKPQSAFFERFGSAGIAALEETLALCRELGVISVLDVKRGDIGSTMGAYAEAYLSADSPLSADSITVSPFLGFGSLQPAIDLARANDRGVFVLALTSNPEGREVQHAHAADVNSRAVDASGRTDAFGPSVAGSIVRQVAELNTAELSAAELNATEPSASEASNESNDPAQTNGLGRFGLVVGATIGTAATDLGLDPSACRGPILAPGVGAQGAGITELRQVFGAQAIRDSQILAATSRAVLQAGPGGLGEAASAMSESLRTV